MAFWQSTTRFETKWRDLAVRVELPADISRTAGLGSRVHEISRTAASFDQLTRELIDLAQTHRLEVELSVDKGLVRRDVMRAVMKRASWSRPVNTPQPH